jgi:hypothetical protein
MLWSECAIAQTRARLEAPLESRPRCFLEGGLSYGLWASHTSNDLRVRALWAARGIASLAEGNEGVRMQKVSGALGQSFHVTQ